MNDLLADFANAVLFDLDDFARAVLDGDASSAARRAYEILASANAATPQHLVLWAAGTIAGSHATRFAGRPTIGVDELAAIAPFTFNAGHREVSCTKAGMRGRSKIGGCGNVLDQVMFTVRWTDVATLVSPADITPEMRTEIEAAATEYTEVMADPDGWDRRRAVMARAEAAGLAVWWAVRPPEVRA